MRARTFGERDGAGSRRRWPCATGLLGLALAVTLAAPACTSAHAAEPRPVRPAVPPATGVREAPASPVYGGSRRIALDGAEARAARAISSAFEDGGAPAPAVDPGLTAAARYLADRALTAGLEAAVQQEEVRLALARGGATVPAPIAIAALAGDEAAALDRLARRARETAAAKAADRPDRFGLGVVRRGETLGAVLLLGRRRAELAPFPARVEVGSTHALAGQVLPPLRAAEIHVTPPGGKPVRLPSGGPGAGFHVPVAFGAPGRWAVEVIGHGPRGPEVAVLLEVWAGRAIPAAARSTPAVAEPDDLPGKLAAVARAVNALRQSKGLRPLSLDTRLVQAARGYAAELAETGRFAHESERSGGPDDRVRKAGYRYRRVGENLAQAPTALEAHRATVESPGHLANLLDPAVTEAGYGLARVRNPDGSTSLVLVELFALPAD